MKDLDILESQISETLCQLETIFPPSFFDIMVHLPIHLVNEVRMGGPVQYRWMYSPKRSLGKLKGYVRNKSRPEGSMAEGYIVEEGLTLCARYLNSGVETRFNRMRRNSENCYPYEVEGSYFFPYIGHPIGGKKKGEAIYLDSNSKNQAHCHILFNCDAVQNFLREHENVAKNLNKKGSGAKQRGRGRISLNGSKTVLGWMMYLMNLKSCQEDQMLLLGDFQVLLLMVIGFILNNVMQEGKHKSSM